MIGQTISHYRITEKLGEGGMGVVYRAEDTRLRRVVALKFLAANALGDEDQKARFLREAQSAALLDHPNIAAVHDIGEAEGRTFMAIAFVDGPELAAKIKERPLKLDEALDVAIQICEGLKEAHEKGVTHRDIKPANIMLTQKGRVKVTDFGLAHLAGRSKLTKSGTSLGTPAYMSPEQALGDPTDRRSDIWGVGVVLYEMIAGKIPFAHEHEQAIMYSIINEKQEPLTAMRTGLPTELDRVIGKALAKKPEERYQHVDDMRVDLCALQKKMSSGKSTALNPTTADETRPTEEPLSRYHVVEKRQESDEQQTYVAEDTKLHRSVEIRVVAQSSAERIERLEKRRRVVPWLIATASLLSALVVAVLWMGVSGPTLETALRRFSFRPQPPVRPGAYNSNVSVSPNGRHIAYIAGEARNLWVQDLDRQQPRVIAETPGACCPFWSPNSEIILFAAGNELKRVSAQGGQVSGICEIGPFYRGTVSPDASTVIFTSGLVPVLYEVSIGGGSARPLHSEQERGQMYADTTVRLISGGRPATGCRKVG